MHAKDMLGDHSISLLVAVVCDNEEQVETRKKRVGQGDVAMRVFVDIVLKW